MISGDYVHPRLLEIQHYHKPPLTYYITAAGYQLFGINEFGARFFLQVSLILQLLLVYKIAQRLFKNERIAFSSAVIYLSFPIVLIATRNLTTDAYLATIILGCIYAYLEYKGRQKPAFLYLCYFLLGLGFLNKGPVILLPVLVFTIPWKIIFKDKWKISIHHILGFLIFVAVSASWFIILIREMPELWNYFFMKHTVDRAISAETFHRDQPFWYFFALAPAVGLPWFIYSIYLLIKNYKAKTAGFKKEINVLLWSGGLLFLMFSAFSSKLILYILPVFPMVAIIGAYYLEEISIKPKKIFSIIYWALIGLTLTALIILPIIGTINLNLTSVIIFVLLFAVATIAVSIKTSDKTRLLSLTFIFTAIILVAFAFVGNQNPYMINTTKKLVQELKEKGLDDAENVIIYDQRLSSTAFYLDRPTMTVHHDRYNTNREVQFEQDSTYKKYYLDINDVEDKERFRKLLNNGDNVFILKGKSTLPEDLQPLLETKKVDDAGKWKIYYSN